MASATYQVRVYPDLRIVILTQPLGGRREKLGLEFPCNSDIRQAVDSGHLAENRATQEGFRR